MPTKAILQICLSKGWGGLEMYPIRTGAKLAARGWKVLGICISGSPVAKAMREQGFTLLEVKSKQQALLKSWQINAWLQQHQTTHIHCHKSGDLLLAALLDNIGTYRIFFTEHMGGSSRKHDLFHRWIYKHVERVFSISDFTRKKNIKNLPIAEQKVTKLWLGTEEQEPITKPATLAATRLALGIPATAKVIGTLGRLDPGKGQLQLIDAFKLIHQQQSDAHLVIVGGLSAEQGSDEDYVTELKQKVADYQLQQRVHFVGFRKDTAEMLAIMDLVCLLSKQEAFGLTVIEAMMAGKLVIGSNSGAIPEILERDELLVSFDQPQEICMKIMALLKQNNSELTQFLLSRAKTHFSSHQHLNSLETYYNMKLNKQTI